MEEQNEITENAKLALVISILVLPSRSDMRAPGAAMRHAMCTNRPSIVLLRAPCMTGHRTHLTHEEDTCSPLPRETQGKADKTEWSVTGRLRDRRLRQNKNKKSVNKNVEIKYYHYCCYYYGRTHELSSLPSSRHRSQKKSGMISRTP